MNPHIPQPPEPPPFPPSDMPFARCLNRRCRHLGMESHAARGSRGVSTIRCPKCGASREHSSWIAAAERRFWLNGVAVILFVGGLLAIALIYGARHQAPERVHGRSLSVPEAR